MAEQINFDLSLYLPDAVEAAAAAYADHAAITLTSNENAVVATIAAEADADESTLAHAFCNHVLHETIVRQRRKATEESES